MKNQLLQFPHIFRKIVAGVKKLQEFLLKIFFLLGAVYFLFLILPVPLTPFEKNKIQTFYHPDNAQSHFLLAQFFSQVNNLDLAEKEVKLATKLELNNKEYRRSLEEILTLKEKPKKLQNELAFWQKISQEKKGFRDAFFEQAIILYQLKNFSQAKEVLQKVFELDPNFKPVFLLLSFLP